MSDIEARVKKIIAEQLGVEESQVTNETVSYTHLTLPTTPYV